MSFVAPKRLDADFADPQLRGAIFEQIAQFIEQNEEVTVDRRVLIQPRTPGNTAGFALATAIRAMKPGVR